MYQVYPCNPSSTPNRVSGIPLAELTYFAAVRWSYAPIVVGRALIPTRRVMVACTVLPNYMTELVKL
jgi:hypothetical protein